MRRAAIPLVLCTLAACGPDIDYEKTELEFELISPPVGGGGQPVYAAAGPIIFTNTHISKDGGATWRENNAALIPTTAIAANATQLLISTTQFGLGRWDMESDQVISIAAPYQIETGNVHVRHDNLTLLVGVYGKQQIARQLKGGHWGILDLPTPPSPPATPFGVYAIESNSDVVIASTTWGLYRSTDDGVDWEFVFQPAKSGNFLTRLTDNSFLMFSLDNTAQQIDKLGMPTATFTPAFPTARPIACLGAIIAGDQYTTDLGQTFKPLIPGGTFRPITLNSAACSGDALYIFISSPTPWIVPIHTLGAPLGVPLLFTPAPAMVNASQAVFASDGTVLAANLAWKPGDTAWNLRIIPDAYIQALADGSLFGAMQQTLYRSHDNGLTWTTTTVPTLPNAGHFFATRDGVLWASSMTADNTSLTPPYTAHLWRSDDDGATWTVVFAKTVQTVEEEAPEVVAIADDDTFVAKGLGTNLYVSHDRGATWIAEPFPRPFLLGFITHGGDAVTFDVDDINPEGHVWHLWHDFGLGNAYRQVTPTSVRVEGEQPVAIELGPSGLQPLLDDSDVPYVFGGGSLVGVYRGTHPL